jgi:hypothetical protein
VPIALRILIGVAAAVLIYLLAVRIIRSMLRPPPPDEPDLANLVPVDYRYRCGVCGAEVTMTAAPGDDDVPDAPRHCKEDMVLLGPRSAPE